MTANIEADQERTGSDREALTEAYSRLAKSVESELLRHALRLTNGDWDWARDLAQDSIVAGYPLYLEGKLAAERNIRAWFMRVLTNRFINQYNRKREGEDGTASRPVLHGCPASLHLHRRTRDGQPQTESLLVGTGLGELLEQVLPRRVRYAVATIQYREPDLAVAHVHVHLDRGFRGRVPRCVLKEIG